MHGTCVVYWHAWPSLLLVHLYSRPMELPNAFLSISACLGAISLSKFLLNVFVWIWRMFFRPAKDLRDYGSWALVTGSTDGIGKALAFELASRGLNLLLVGRNPSKLWLTSREIKQRHGGVAVREVVIDFASCRGEEIARIIKEETEGLDLGIVVNNAGLSYPYPRFCHEVDVELMTGVVRVNAEAATWVTKAVIPRMMERRKGAIVNIGSGSSTSVSSFPLFTLYAATKAYIGMLSKSIGLEYKQHGIDVQCQIPLLVATKMTSIRKSSIFIPSAEAYSKASIRWIGHRHRICMPYWPHAMQACLLRLLPETLQDWCFFRYFLWVRERGLRKDPRIVQDLPASHNSGHIHSH